MVDGEQVFCDGRRHSYTGLHVGNILVVDDESLFAMSVAEVLTEAGFSARCECTGRRAISTALCTSLAGAIVDLGLPDCSGEEVVRAIRHAHPSIPIILCSGFNKKESSALAEELQLRVVEKPIEDAVLVGMLVTNPPSAVRDKG